MVPKERVQKIQDYVYAKYVEGSTVTPIDEVDACRFLDTYYSHTANRNDPNCCYAGILWFEVSYLPDEDQTPCLERARFWLEHAEGLTEDGWQPITERLIDIRSLLGESSETN